MNYSDGNNGENQTASLASIPNNSAAPSDNPTTMSKNHSTQEVDHGVRKQCNLPKSLRMMTEGNGSITPNRRGSDQRRQSNVFDAVDLTATLLAITHNTVDLNATTSIDDDVLKATIVSHAKGKKKTAPPCQMNAINELECSSDDSDEQVPEKKDEQDKRSKIDDPNTSGKSMSTIFTSLGLEHGGTSTDTGSVRKVSLFSRAPTAGNDHDALGRKTSSPYHGTGWEAALMGFTIVAGGQLYGWNSGFSAGFGSYFIAQVMVGSAYVILLCCLSENTAALAFPGGSYGLARVCLGFYPGYLVACCEMMEYVFMSSASVFYVGQMAVSCAKLDPSYAPVFWLLFYGFGIATTCSSLKVMWYTSTILCMIILILLLIYCIGSARYTNLALYGPYWDNTATYVPVMGNNNLTYSLDYTTTMVVTTKANGMNVTMALGTPLMPTNLWDPSYWFVGGMSGWMSTLTVCTWAYAGIECLVLMTDMMKEPKKNIPIGCAGGISMLFVTNIATTIICASMPPGLFTTVGNPTYMSLVYQLIFPHLSDAGAWLLILPGQIGMGWGFFAPVGKLLQALGQSNLLPRFLCLNDAESHRTGVVVGCAMGLILCIVGHFKASFGAALQNIAISCACIQYFANLYSFISLKTTFKQVEREFKSPFGITGAVICMCIFMLVLISTLFFQSDGFMGTRQYTTLTTICVIVMLLSLWYFLFVTGAQCFSPSEQKTVFRMHVYQFNMKKNKSREEVSTCDKCSAFVYLRSIYATAWNKFDMETKRISKSIDEKMDERYFRAWQYFMGSISRDGATGKIASSLDDGLSTKSSSRIHNPGRRSLESHQIFVAPPPSVTAVPPSSHTADHNIPWEIAPAAGGGGSGGGGEEGLFGSKSSQKDTSPLLK